MYIRLGVGDDLPLVLAAQIGRAVKLLGGGRQHQERKLADLHPLVECDGQVGNVAQLKREVAFPARIDVTPPSNVSAALFAPANSSPPTARRGGPESRCSQG